MSCHCKTFQPPGEFQSLFPARDVELFSLLRNNINSSDVAASTLISTAKDDLDRCRKILRAFEDEHMRMEGIIYSLKNQEKALERVYKNATSLESPIRKVSPEILQTIFAAVDVTNIIPHDERGSWGMEAMHIAGVCRHWRKVALSTKQLWCNIVFRPCGNPDHHPPMVRVLQKVLSLSGRLPLTISYGGGALSAPLTALLCAESDRWCSVSTTTIGLLLQMVDHSKLRHLELQPMKAVPIFPSGVTDIVLKGIRNPNQHILWSRYYSPQPSILHLDMHELPLSCVLRLAKHCPALLSLAVDDCYLDTIANDLSSVRISTLETLVLNSCTVGTVAKLFSSLTLPQLNSISIRDLYTDGTDSRQRTYATLFPVMDLGQMLAREMSTPKSLSMSGVILSRSRLESVLKLFPSLESLTFCENSDDAGANSPVLDNLLNRMNPSVQLSAATTLVPKLRYLKLDVRGLLFSSRTFVDMVRARWNLSTTSGRTSLNLKTLVLHAPRKFFEGDDLRALRVLHRAGMQILFRAGKTWIDLDAEE